VRVGTEGGQRQQMTVKRKEEEGEMRLVGSMLIEEKSEEE
jgi:hypothetical protein